MYEADTLAATSRPPLSTLLGCGENLETADNRSMTRPNPTVLAAAAAAGLSMLVGVGCTSDSPVGGLLGDNERRVEPRDFVGQPPVDFADPTNNTDSAAINPVAKETADASVVMTATSEAPRAAATDSALSAAPPQRIDPDEPVPVDGMIGQINGRPVYADDVLADLSDSLAAKGRQLSADAFRDDARATIAEAVKGTLQSRLILAEAERALTENEWQIVRYMRQQKREELLRMHGMGSLKATDRVLGEETGRGLDETLERFQEEIITRTYLSQNLNALINVTRRDIERFYRDNFDRFQPEPTRDLTIIVTDTPEDAETVRAELDAGVSFAEIAAGDLNRLSTDGTMTSVKGNQPFGRPEIEGPMVDADADDWFGPIEVEDGRLWFVKVDQIDRQPHIALEDAQASIESALREQQQSLRTQQFLKRLADEGNFTEPDEMVDALTRIAVSRYGTR